VESGEAMRFSMRKHAAVSPVSENSLVETDADAPLYSLVRAQETELPAALKLSYVESGLDYRAAVVESKYAGGSSLRDLRLDLPCAVDQSQAQRLADVALQESRVSRETAGIALPPSLLHLEPGDVIALQLSAGAIELRLDDISDGSYRKVGASRFDFGVVDAPPAASRRLGTQTATVYGKPSLVILDLPIATAGTDPQAPWFGATASPWPGSLAVLRKTGTTSYALNRTIDRQATKGVLLEPLSSGPLYVFDRVSTVVVRLQRGALASVSEAELLQGLNLAAIGSRETGWEVIQFASAELVDTRTYRLSVLLRGQSGSEPEMVPVRPAGERFVLLNRALVQPKLSLSEAGLAQTWRVGPAQYDMSRAHVTVEHQSRMLGLRPLSPCHLRARRDGSDVVFTWLRRTRIDGDSWDLAEVPLGEEAETYAVSIIDGALVKRSLYVSDATYRYGAAQIAADFGADPGVFTLRIAQVSATFGAGAILQRTIHA
jgi:hypothetical protein